jgi:hypothetical protein
LFAFGFADAASGVAASLRRTKRENAYGVRFICKSDGGDLL